MNRQNSLQVNSDTSFCQKSSNMEGESPIFSEISTPSQAALDDCLVKLGFNYWIHPNRHFPSWPRRLALRVHHQ